MFKKGLRSFLSKNKHWPFDRVVGSPRVSTFELRLPAGGDFKTQDRLTLYRFLAENIPLLNGAIWLWTRLCAAPVEFRYSDLDDHQAAQLRQHLDHILAPLPYQKSGGIESLVTNYFRSLFLDGCFGGQAILNASGSGLSGFAQYDSRFLSFEKDDRGWQIFYDDGRGKSWLDPGSFYYVGLDAAPDDPRGTSILAAVGFVSHLEQKLTSDMSSALEKSGYHRVQVKLRKPDRLPGESDAAYLKRANAYFDNTVDLFRNLNPADSAVTWDDIEISTIGPSGQAGASSWYLYHRALVESVCAGVHLDPFMLGYSFGTTQTWARFRFEMMMRQIVAVQEKARGFFQWLLGLEMALRGLPGTVTVVFDNRKVFGSLERFQAEKIATERIIAQYQAGLISQKEAKEQIERIEPGII